MKTQERKKKEKRKERNTTAPHGTRATTHPHMFFSDPHDRVVTRILNTVKMSCDWNVESPIYEYQASFCVWEQMKLFSASLPCVFRVHVHVSMCVRVNVCGCVWFVVDRLRRVESVFGVWSSVHSTTAVSDVCGRRERKAG